VASDHKNILADVGIGIYEGFAPTIDTGGAVNILAITGLGIYQGFAPVVTAGQGTRPRIGRKSIIEDSLSYPSGITTSTARKSTIQTELN